MKISIIRQKDDHRQNIDTLERGDIFSWGTCNTFFMMITPSKNSEVINLHTGELQNLQCDLRVWKLEGELIVKVSC
jgi:hypothetical protein